MTTRTEAMAAVEWFSAHVAAALAKPKRILLVGSGEIGDAFRTTGHEVLAMADIQAWIDADSPTQGVSRPDLAAVCEMPQDEDDLPALLDYLATALAPGSLLFMLIPNPSSLRAGLTASRGNLYGVSALRRTVSLERLEDLLETAGFVTTGIARRQQEAISQEGLEWLPPTVRGQITSLDSAATSHIALRSRMVTPDASREIRGAMPLNPEADQAAVEMRLRMERYERGTQVLRQLLFTEGEARQMDVAERDARIVALQAELFAKVGERDAMIRSLQQELHQKVGERDRAILKLQQRMAKKTSATEADSSSIVEIDEKMGGILSDPGAADASSADRGSSDADPSHLREALSLADLKLREAAAREARLVAELESIHRSRFWKAMTLYWRVRARL